MLTLEKALTASYNAHEAARCKVDRIAFAGQIPVNARGVRPGQYIVAAQDGRGIKRISKDKVDMTLCECMRSVGKVIAIETDGRAHYREGGLAVRVEKLSKFQLN